MTAGSATTATTAHAVLLDAPAPIEEGPLRLGELGVPAPATGQIVIEVTACGVCRSNLHMIEGDWVEHGVPAKTPIVPGHEVVGRVAQVGAGVDWLQPGDRVGVQPLWSTCGHCDFCLAGREQLCPAKEITGETVDGGYATHMLATAAHAYRVPDPLDDAAAAPLFCPGITAYNAVSKAGLTPGSSVAVFGIGGVGHMALQFAALTGAEVIAVTRSQEHRDLALELGAHRAIDASGGDVAQQLQAAGGVNASIVFAPSSEAVRQAVAATKPAGTIVVGVHAEVGEVPFVEEKRVVGSVIGARWQMKQVLRMAAAGMVRSVYEPFPLDEAPEALRRLKQGELRARAVLVT
ncbi:MAG: alcohol dehydrogenase catalytic domain-containing protein [Actinomycetota bacterium]|nr:alcohol dehydrogenase catalytic domain-containing protein [Actinomycetota bacterium]MDA8279567.1 alcohol dehydrogenase catalytic domain-containing protein [Actinomycetota bacterium]